MKVGIFGGTFDPIHTGHLFIAEQAKQHMKLDQVWFVPAKSPPHKKRVTPVHHRVEMVRLALADHLDFCLSEVEIKRPGLSYTIDTIKELITTNPNVEFYLIVGADSVKDMPNWHRIREIIKLVKIIGVYRPHIPLDNLPSWLNESLIWIQEEIGIHVSSSYIRQVFSNSQLLRYVMPNTVYQYIEENQLYAD